MPVKRYAVRTACLILVACLIGAGGDPWGGGMRGGAAASAGATVQVEYKGSWTATYIQTLDTKAEHSEKVVTTVSWDFVWSGTLDQLLNPFMYSQATKGYNILTPRRLTGTTSVTYSGTGLPPNCTATLSYNPDAIRNGVPIASGSVLNSSLTNDSSSVNIQVALPSSQSILRSSNPRNVGNGAGDCNSGDYRAAGTDPHKLYVPDPVFSLAHLAKKQTQTYSGVNKEVRSGLVGSDVIASSVSLVAASCTGPGSSNVGALLFGCYVALGDSYSAGQMPPFVPGGEACARSTLAYAYLYDKNVAFAACSGAKVADVLSTQILFLHKTTKLVTITIGGNDTGIIGSLIACLGKSVSVHRCANASPPPDFAGLKSRLIALYAAIHSRAPDARIFVFGYPIVLPPTAPSFCAGLYLPGTRIGIFPSDVPYFYGLLTKLNDTVHQAARASRDTTFVSPDLLFGGHDICASSPYFFPLDAINALETLHPNATGHAELAALLHRAAGPPPD